MLGEILVVDAEYMTEEELDRLLDDLIHGHDSTPVTPVKKRAKVRREKAYNKAYNQALNDLMDKIFLDPKVDMPNYIAMNETVKSLRR